MTVSALFFESDLEMPLLRRTYSVGMPQMLLGGLGERWLLKESGDAHWALVCNDLGVGSSNLTDAEGDRLYASFLRVRMEASSHLGGVRENDQLSLEASLSRFGDKRYYSSLVYRTGKVEIRCTLGSVFTSRAADNRSLARSKARNFQRSTCFAHPVVPPFGQGYHSVKETAVLNMPAPDGPLVHLAGEVFEWATQEHFTTEYTVNPYYDFNGVSLLYFASYGRIHDICEREAVHRRPWRDDWALVTAPLARDIFYYANANAGERLLFKLFRQEFRGDHRVALHSALFRASDGVRIADIFTVRQLIDRRSDLAALWDAS